MAKLKIETEDSVRFFDLSKMSFLRITKKKVFFVLDGVNFEYHNAAFDKSAYNDHSPTLSEKRFKLLTDFLKEQFDIGTVEI